MTIEFTCANCNSTLRVPAEHAGKKAKCPQCQGLNAIPGGGAGPKASGGSPFASASVGASPFAARHEGMQSTGLSGLRKYQPHRAALVLTMGVMALVCNIMLVPGICAWVMGRSDIKQMDAGQMDPEGRGATFAGMILGIIATCFVVVAVFLYLALIVFVLAVAASVP